jgi:hypothetical protein
MHGPPIKQAANPPPGNKIPILSGGKGGCVSMTEAKAFCEAKLISNKTIAL